MDLNLYEAKLSLHCPLWVKLLPLAFVVVIAVVLMVERPWDQPACVTPGPTAQAQVQCADDVPRSDVSTPTHPH